MIVYSTLENVSEHILFEANLKTMDPNGRLIKEVDLNMFSEMLKEHDYDPSISMGAFDEETGECVGMVLNCILKDREKTAYDIVTCTIPEYRRKGIARNIFENVKILLRERGIKRYITETKRTNTVAQNMYRALGFEIGSEVVTTLKTPNGSRQIEQVEVVMDL